MDGSFNIPIQDRTFPAKKSGKELKHGFTQRGSHTKNQAGFPRTNDKKCEQTQKVLR